MQTVKNRQGFGSTKTFPLKGTLPDLQHDLAPLGFPVDMELPDDDEVHLTTIGGPSPDGNGYVGAVSVGALLEHEEKGQPTDLLDVLARHVREGHVVVLDESTFRGNTARRWAVDSKGARVSIDLVDLETQIVEHLDCSAGVPDLD